VPVTLGETFGVGPHVGELVRRNPHVLTREPGDGRRGDLHGIEGDTPGRQLLELALAAAGSSGGRPAHTAARARGVGGAASGGAGQGNRWSRLRRGGPAGP